MTDEAHRLAQEVVDVMCADPEIWLTHGMPSEGKLARITEYIATALRQRKSESTLSASGEDRLYVGRDVARFLTLHVDPSLPDDVIEIRASGDGLVLGRIINIARP